MESSKLNNTVKPVLEISLSTSLSNSESLCLRDDCFLCMYVCLPVCLSSFNWFHLYLASRQQVSCVEGVTSTAKMTTCGVPQGATLGPLLFLKAFCLFRSACLDLPV